MLNALLEEERVEIAAHLAHKQSQPGQILSMRLEVKRGACHPSPFLKLLRMQPKPKIPHICGGPLLHQ